MTIFGKAVKGIVERAAYGADLVMNKTAQGIEKKFGEREIVKTVSEIGSGTVRVTQTTLKTVTDVVDGGLEAGWGYLSHDEEKKNQGWETSKTAGKDFLTGVGKGLVYTVAAGAVTASSAVTAGKHLVQGDAIWPGRSLIKPKDMPNIWGKRWWSGCWLLAHRRRHCRTKRQARLNPCQRINRSY